MSMEQSGDHVICSLLKSWKRNWPRGERGTSAGRRRDSVSRPVVTTFGVSNRSQVRDEADEGRRLRDVSRTELVTIRRAIAAAVLCGGFCVPPAVAATDAEVQELKAAVQALIATNQELSKRLSALEAANPAPQARSEAGPSIAPSRQTPFRPEELPTAAKPPPERAARVTSPRGGSSRPPPPSASPSLSADPLERRVKELELAKTAQESAVRTIIQDANSKAGSKINEFVTFGGALEVLGGRSSDFSGAKTDKIALNTAELDFEIRANDWILGTLVLSFNDGTNVLFPTTNASNLGVDRFTVDRASVFIGDVQRFPLYLKAGFDVLPFGTSTGVHRSDVLSLENPLTVEVFETRAKTVGIGFALPTPTPGPPSPSFIAPNVEPLVLNPLVSKAAGYLGYKGFPSRVKRPTPTAAPIEPPPFYGSVYVYDANTVENVNRRFSGNLNGRLGYQTQGTCGRSYSELTDSYLCPWALDVSVDYLGSVFDSKFLEDGYRAFIPQIGKVPGMAASLKLSFGPFLLVGEWNGAITAARFVDDVGRQVKMSPSAWAVSLGYQFDWNPWVETIGAKGDYVSIGYSQTQQLGGVTQSVNGVPTRVGFAPKSRLILTAGEWVLDGTRVLIEYSHIWDYAPGHGGTGRQADGVFAAITYVW
jgi:hypothetical protein